MKPLEKIRPDIEEKFRDHPNFYRIYEENKKLFIAFSDMAMAVSAMGWDIYFVEILHKKGPIEKILAYAKLCKNKDQLLYALQNARDKYVKPDFDTASEPKDRVGFKVDIRHLIEERMKDHPKFVKLFAGYEKLFIVFEDILILVEPIGGSFYTWELFRREGDVEVSSIESGSKIGFDKIVDTVVDLRERFE